MYQESRSRTQVGMAIVTSQRRRTFRNRLDRPNSAIPGGRGSRNRTRMRLGVSFVGERERRTQLKGQRGGAEREGKRESSHS